jgi:heme iron utilization protein
MPDAPTPEALTAEFRELLESVRVGVLITMNDDGPFGSHVPFLLGDDWTSAVIHVSKLSQHTKNLERDPRISLFVAEADEPKKNPLSLRRANLQGRGVPLERGSEAYEATRERYVARFKQSAQMFQFGDFLLWSLQMRTAHFVAGFGKAFLAASDRPSDWIHQGK